MSWLRANRLSAKDPLDSSPHDINNHSSVDQKSKKYSKYDYSTPSKIRSNPSFSQ